MTEAEKLKGFVGEYRTSIGTNWSAGDKGRTEEDAIEAWELFCRGDE